MISFLKRVGAIIGLSAVCVQSSFAYTILDTPYKTTGEIFSEAFQNTVDSDFSATIGAKISIDGKSSNWGGVTTDYIIDTTAKKIFFKKVGDLMSYELQNATVDFSINSDDEDNALFFPFKGTVNFSEDAVINTKKFQFAWKGVLNTINIDNPHVKNLIGGFLEIAKLFNGRWITVNLVGVEKEFPALQDTIIDLKKEIHQNFDVDNIESLVENLTVWFDFAIAKGDLHVIKLRNVYTITDINKNLTITIVLTPTHKIASIAVNGNVSEPGKSEYLNTDIDMNIDFSYASPSIVFPATKAENFDLTAFYKMYFELQNKIYLQQQKENHFYLDLNVFTGDVHDAIEFLLQNGNPTDIAFVKAYTKSIKNFDRRIRLKDLRKLSIYNFPMQDIIYLYDSIKYRIDVTDSEQKYRDKDAIELLLNIFDSSTHGVRLHYIDLNILNKINYSLHSRGDILIFLAKLRKAEQLRDSK